MDPITLDLPIYVEFGKRKKTTFSLNLNTYRNAHFQILNKTKVLFEEIITSRIHHLPRMAKVKLTYSLFFGSRRAIDVANICCIVDKFFCDTLVNAGKLPDDSREIIASVQYQWGNIDKDNPRVEVTLSDIEMAPETETQETEQPMKILLTPSEIGEALNDYVRKQVILRDDQTINIELITQDGVATAEITVSRPAETQAVTQPQKAAPARRAEPRKETAPPPESKTESQTEPKVETKVESTVEASPEVTAEVKAEVRDETPAPAIFPSTASSAPPGSSTAELPPKPAGGPKSLFANLTRPVHDAPNGKTVN